MNTNKKEKNVKNNNINIIIIAVGVVILLLVGFIVIKGCSKSSKNNEETQEEKIKMVGASEEDLISSYGMSKNDAIEIVKTIYNSDNYEFSADINEDSKYIISVKNLITEKVDKYLVDPTSTNKSFYLVTE